MRWEFVLAAALAVLFTANAHAEDWCGYAARDKALIECGYTSAAECESATGKGGVCFVDPDYALDVRRVKTKATG